MKKNRRAFIKASAAASLLPSVATQAQATPAINKTIPPMLTMLLDDGPSFVIGAATSAAPVLATPVRLDVASSDTVTLRIAQRTT